MSKIRSAALIAAISTFAAIDAANALVPAVGGEEQRRVISGVPLDSNNIKTGWITSGRLPKRRSFKERKARRSKRAQRAR